MQTWTPWTSVCRSWLMSLIMTFMFEPAKLQMNCARASGTSIFRSDPAAVFRSAAVLVTSSCPRALADSQLVVELLVQVDRRADQRQVAERLREVPELVAGLADLLGIQAEV